MLNSGLILTAALLSAAAPARRAGTLRVEIRDIYTRKASAARVRVSADRKNYWFFVDGKVSVKLPAGNYRLRLDAGPLRLPYDQHITVFPGRTTRRVVFLTRPPRLLFKRRGWLAVDPLFSAGGGTGEAVALAARIADLDAIGLERITDADAWKLVGRLPVFRWGTASDPRYGSKCCFDARWLPAPNVPRGLKPAKVGPADFSIYADCGRPRRFNPWRTAVPWKPELARFYELLSSRPLATRGVAPRMYYELAAGRQVGGFELDGTESAEKLWFALLKQGYRVPALAGSRGSLARGERPRPRMLVEFEPRPDLKWPAADWLLRRLRAGTSSMSFGPFCFLSIDGRGPGWELPAAEKERRLVLRALASTEQRAQITRVEVYRNGEIFQKVTVPPGRTMFQVQTSLRQEEPAWFVAKCYQRVRKLPGEKDEHPEKHAITNPIWIEPKTYSTRPKAVRTKLRCKVVDAETGRPVPVVFTGSGRATDAEGLKPRVAAGLLPGEFCFECPTGSFGVEVPPTCKMIFRAAMKPGAADDPVPLDYEEQHVQLIEALGLTVFAKKLAAMPPEEAAKQLSDPLTMGMLRRSMRNCELTVRLRRKRSP